MYMAFSSKKMLVVALFFITKALAVISGSIMADNYEVQARNVTYTFQLNFQTTLSPSTTKIVIRFPSDFQDDFTTYCAPIAGFNGPNLNCNYMQSSRMLTLSGSAFPTILSQIQFRVSNITNPQTVRTTAIFSVSAYSSSGTSFVLKETGGNGLSVTTTSGAITAQGLSLADPTVGVYSDLTLQLTSTHAIPSDGQILFTLPKWNQQNPIQSSWVSLLSVPVVPGAVDCEATSGVISQETKCQFSSGSQSDQIIIQLSELNSVASGTIVSFVIKNFRAPPSQSPLAGFGLMTMSNSGQIIDQWKATMFLVATKPAIAPSSSIALVVSPTQITSDSTAQLTIQNTIPLLTGSTIQITIPLDFNVTTLNVSFSGQNLVSLPVFTYDAQNRNIRTQAFNTQYLDSFSVSVITINGLKNPAQTSVTQSFGVTFFDPNGKSVELVNTGATFQATPGGFNLAAVTTQNLQVSAVNVYYNFQLWPQHSASSAAILKLTFPSDFWVNPSAYITNQGNQIGPTPAVKVLYNQEVYITQAFPNGYNANQPIKFTLTGITNPITAQKTQPITVSLFYQEGIDLVDQYLGNNMTVTAQSASILQISASLSTLFTGQINEQFIITGSTPFKMPIAKGASLVVFIPPQFIIKDPIRVASSCAAISGFSDQIQCFFESTSLSYGSYLQVTQGFQSKNFQGGSFSFSISEVLNPFTSAVSDPFSFEVRDSFGKLQYTMDLSKTPFTLYVNPSEFAFAFVSSSSYQNGMSSLYTFTVTLNIDTEVGTYLLVTLPGELKFDTSVSFRCNGTLNLLPSLPCFYRNTRSFSLILMPIDNRINTFKNGTTLQFDTGFIINSFSLAPTSSFAISTFTLQGNQGTEYIYINQQLNGLSMTNKESGLIYLNNITQLGSKDLNQATKLQISLTTREAIPQESILTVILPTNFQFTSSLQVIVNNRIVNDAQLNAKTFTLTLTIQQDLQKNFNILINQGLQNPSTGPYEYSQFNFQFTYNNYLISSISSDEIWITVPCNGNCSSCSGSLAGCQTCGLINNVAFYLFNKTCVQNCPSGYYGDAGYQCLQCRSPCLECSVGPDMCTKCDPTKGNPFVSLITQSCYNKCPSGTYQDLSLSRCVACELPCYSCTSQSECLTCDLSNQNNTRQYYFGQTKSCVEECPPITVPSPSKICVDCESPCKTCQQSPDTCVSCIAGLYLYKNQCLKQCPFNYYSDNTEMKCKAIASLKVPFPFTIIAFVFSVGIGLASFMKSNHKTGEGTAFFITALALVDVLLRVNWFVLGVLSLQQTYLYLFFGCSIILTVSLFLNLGVWRRFFKFKYNLDENDRLYVSYSLNYPRTSKWILFVSYLITFQAFRLSYSRLLGKKQFCAEFTRSRVYYRLIGRLSIMAIIFLYLPAIALNLYGLIFLFEMGDQIFYIGLDSLVLVVYATVLILVTLTQREKLIDQKQLLKFGELCRCNVPSDDEKMYFEDIDDDQNRQNRRKSPLKITGDCQDNLDGSAHVTQHLDEIELDVMSAAGFEELKKQKLYQTELRYNKEKVLQIPEVSNLLDYNQYIVLQDKVNRIILKRNLYENRRMNDYNDLQDRRSDLTSQLREHEALSVKLDQLKKYLTHLQAQIAHTQEEKTVKVNGVKQKKKQEIAKRNTSNSENSQRPFTLNSIQGSVSTPHQQLFGLDLHHTTTEAGDQDIKEQSNKDEFEDKAKDQTQTQQIISTYPNRMQATTDSQDEEEQSILREFENRQQLQRQSFGPNAQSRNFRDI